MLKISIVKGEKDQSDLIYMKEENGELELLTFETIKKYALRILDAVSNGNDHTYEINVDDNGLLPYKETVENVLKSIIDDAELQELYKKTVVENKEKEK